MNGIKPSPVHHSHSNNHINRPASAHPSSSASSYSSHNSTDDEEELMRSNNNNNTQIAEQHNDYSKHNAAKAQSARSSSRSSSGRGAASRSSSSSLSNSSDDEDVSDLLSLTSSSSSTSSDSSSDVDSDSSFDSEDERPAVSKSKKGADVEDGEIIEGSSSSASHQHAQQYQMVKDQLKQAKKKCIAYERKLKKLSKELKVKKSTGKKISDKHVKLKKKLKSKYLNYKAKLTGLLSRQAALANKDPTLGRRDADDKHRVHKGSKKLKVESGDKVKRKHSSRKHGKKSQDEEDEPSPRHHHHRHRSHKRDSSRSATQPAVITPAANSNALPPVKLPYPVLNDKRDMQTIKSILKEKQRSLNEMFEKTLATLKRLERRKAGGGNGSSENEDDDEDSENERLSPEELEKKRTRLRNLHENIKLQLQRLNYQIDYVKVNLEMSELRRILEQDDGADNERKRPAGERDRLDKRLVELNNQHEDLLAHMKDANRRAIKQHEQMAKKIEEEEARNNLKNDMYDNGMNMNDPMRFQTERGLMGIRPGGAIGAHHPLSASFPPPQLPPTNLIQPNYYRNVPPPPLNSSLPTAVNPANVAPAVANNHHTISSKFQPYTTPASHTSINNNSNTSLNSYPPMPGNQMLTPPSSTSSSSSLNNQRPLPHFNTNNNNPNFRNNFNNNRNNFNNRAPPPQQAPLVLNPSRVKTPPMPPSDAGNRSLNGAHTPPNSPPPPAMSHKSFNKQFGKDSEAGILDSPPSNPMNNRHPGNSRRSPNPPSSFGMNNNNSPPMMMQAQFQQFMNNPAIMQAVQSMFQNMTPQQKQHAMATGFSNFDFNGVMQMLQSKGLVNMNDLGASFQGPTNNNRKPNFAPKPNLGKGIMGNGSMANSMPARNGNSDDALLPNPTGPVIGGLGGSNMAIFQDNFMKYINTFNGPNTKMNTNVTNNNFNQSQPFNNNRNKMAMPAAVASAPSSSSGPGLVPTPGFNTQLNNMKPNYPTNNNMMMGNNAPNFRFNQPTGPTGFNNYNNNNNSLKRKRF